MKSSFIITLYVAVVLIVTSCRRETAVQQDGGAGGTASGTAVVTAPPQDLRNAQVNTVFALDPGVYLVDSKVGPAIGANGLVEEEKTEFTAGQDIHLSLWLKESPSGLQTSATLADADGKEVDTERKPMNGEKTVTFTLGDGKLKPGKYKLTGYWGGNIAAEYDITVNEAPKSAPRSKSRAKSKS